MQQSHTWKRACWSVSWAQIEPCEYVIFRTKKMIFNPITELFTSQNWNSDPASHSLQIQNFHYWNYIEKFLFKIGTKFLCLVLYSIRKIKIYIIWIFFLLKWWNSIFMTRSHQLNPDTFDYFNNSNNFNF